MTDTSLLPNSPLGAHDLAARLAQNPDGVLEALAREHGVSTLDATRMLPAHLCVFAPATAFDDVMAELTGWGEVLVIVHTPSIVLECEGPVPPGSFGRGFFNLHGDSPIGGHLRAENCTSIAFVSRPFMGRPSRSLQFFNGAGEAMFEIFVRRDEARDLLVEQVEKFDALRQRLSARA